VNDLRAYYRESSLARLAELRAAFDAGAIGELRRHFHAFSGMGGTYGYPRVSILGDEAEGLLQSPDAAALARCRELMDEIARELC
jgi:HPt (histidine-containing phosphotransfer) domain-containing protein